MQNTKRSLRKSPSRTNSVPRLQVQTATPLTSDTEAQNEAVLSTLTPSPPEALDIRRVVDQQREHEQKVQEFQKVFNENLQNAPVRHDRVCVLLLSWENNIDDCNVEDEVTSLQTVFEKQYGFQVTRERMNHEEKPQYQINYYLSCFLKANDKPNALLIIYYAGHGSYDIKGPKRGLKFHAYAQDPIVQSRSQRTPEEKQRNDIAWCEAERTLDNPDADVLVIFDCCQAGGVGGHDTRHRSPPPNPNFEFLAACAPDQRTRKPGPHSFTSALMWALEKLRRDDKPFTTNTLWEEIMKYEKLPQGQNPGLTTRKPYADAFIWIIPLNLSEEEMPKDMRNSYPRQPDYECIDLRLHYYTNISKDDVAHLGKVLSNKIETDTAFMAKDAVLLNTSSKTSRRNEAVYKAKDQFLSLGKRRRSSASLRETSSDLGSPIVIPPDSPSIHGSPPRPVKRRKSNEIEIDTRQEQQIAIHAADETAIGRPWYHLQMFVYGSFLGVLTPLTNGVARMRARITDQPHDVAT